MTSKRIYPVAYTKVEGGQWNPFGLGKSHPRYWKAWLRTVPHSVKFSDGRIWDNHFKGWRPAKKVFHPIAAFRHKESEQNIVTALNVPSIMVVNQ